MKPIDRDALAQVIEADTIFSLETFEKAFGPVVDRKAAWRVIQNWKNLKTAFPDATLFAVRNLEPKEIEHGRS